MMIDDELLSAFLDGEVSAQEAQAIEQALDGDSALQARLEALMSADALAQDEFAAMLEEPVPFELAAAIQAAPEGPEPANVNVPQDTPAPARSGWLIAAAVAGALAVGGGVGFQFGQSEPTQVADTRTWLDDIADYHAVYSEQVRHLVEVPASEADHIETWLTATIGADVRIPDLSANGLSFEGARLLVAAGRPVSQLLYTDAEGRVVALCQIATDTPRTDVGNRTIGAFDMVIFGGNDANFVVVTDTGREDLGEIAESAATQA